MKVMDHFIRDFFPWELIHEIGVINSGVKSRGQYEIELRSSLLSNWSSGRVVEGLKGVTARNLRNMRAFIWHYHFGPESYVTVM